MRQKPKALPLVAIYVCASMMKPALNTAGASVLHNNEACRSGRGLGEFASATLEILD